MYSFTTLTPAGEAFPPRTRQPRQGCQYNAEEVGILNKHKANYRKTTMHEERDVMLRTTILVDIFNHWVTIKGLTFDENEIRKHMKVGMNATAKYTIVITHIQAVCVWIRNNWRPHNTVNRASSTRKSSYVDIVWNERQEDVLNEIKTILQRPEPTQQEIFLTRTKAASRVYRRLTPDEQASIERRLETAERNPNPPEIQQR